MELIKLLQKLKKLPPLEFNYDAQQACSQNNNQVLNDNSYSEMEPYPGGNIKEY